MFGKLSFFAGCSYLVYLAFDAAREARAHRSTKKMDTDFDGNYDLDGVSYDPHSHTVAVTGDNRIPSPLAETTITLEVVALNTPSEPKQRAVGA
jgi:hypothetical protein